MELWDVAFFFSVLAWLRRNDDESHEVRYSCGFPTLRMTFRGSRTRLPHKNHAVHNVEVLEIKNL